MAGKMGNWIAYQQRHLSEADFAAWIASDVKVKSYLDRQQRIPAAVRALEDLQKEVLKKVIGPGLEKASKFLAQIEKADAAGLSQSGVLAQSIGSTKARLYPSTFCGYVASGPRRGFARAVVQTITHKGQFRSKRLSKKATETAGGGELKNPVVYARYVRSGRKAVVAGQRGSGARALVSASGQFFGHKVKATSPRDFMAGAVASADQAAGVAVTEMNTQTDTLLGAQT